MFFWSSATTTTTIIIKNEPFALMFTWCMHQVLLMGFLLIPGSTKVRGKNVEKPHFYFPENLFGGRIFLWKCPFIENNVYDVD